ncbi:MAG: GAF domain-containing protein, partial [Tabrizicola sp.]
MRHVAHPDIVEAEPARVEFRVVELMNRLLDVTPDTLDAEVDAVLAAIGQAYGFDRTFVFRFESGIGYFNTHEWVGNGAKALKSAMGVPHPISRPAWHAMFLTGQVVAVTSRDDLPAGSPERAFLTDIGVHSTLMVPLMDADRLFGIIGFDCARPDRTWPQDVVFLLTSISRAVSSVLLRVEAARAEAALRSHLAATLSALPDLVIELAPAGEIVACHSDKLPWLSSLVRAGIGRPLAEMLPEPLAEVLQSFLANPPPDNS